MCCQIGAREHYAAPRALRKHGALDHLITDLWVNPGSVAGQLSPLRLRERFHPDLADAEVWAPGPSALVFESRHALSSTRGWKLIQLRNEWFQDRAIERLRDVAKRRSDGSLIVFAYSYAARRIFEFARSRGWTTVLGQIDPGPPEERIVNALNAGRPDLAGAWEAAPSSYWSHWKDECRLADRVVVNSTWSERALGEEGVPGDKMRVVPLAYEPTAGASSFERTYPNRFTRERPLRVLFLGQVILRKGMAAVLEAMELLRREPVEFSIVGQRNMAVPSKFLECDRATWTGSVSRAEAISHYRGADLFLFPTFSDGFGLTQLEAQAWKLPILASRFCGDVVVDGENGRVLPSITGAEIASQITDLIAQPAKLAAMSHRARVSDDFSVDRFGQRLLAALA